MVTVLLLHVLCLQQYFLFEWEYAFCAHIVPFMNKNAFHDKKPNN